jgi:hypothetical protein
MRIIGSMPFYIESLKTAAKSENLTVSDGIEATVQFECWPTKPITRLVLDDDCNDRGLAE